jgi:hypothetical protein
MECWPAVSGQQADEAASGFQSTDLFADKA